MDMTGLSQDEAARRLAQSGPNELPRPPGRGVIEIVVETLREPMFALLLGAAALYLALGDLGEGLFMLAGAAAAVALVVVQEARSERALARLRELAQPQVRVIRDGVARKVAARELVIGDLILVGEGERLAADALLVTGDVLSVDESVLTGESAPVAKRPAGEGEGFAADAEPGRDEGPQLFSGALVVGGQGVAQVARTGSDSLLGRLGRSLAAIVEERTPLQKSAGRVVSLLSIAALMFCAFVAFGYGWMHHDWLGGVLAGITFAIALIPEEFPMVLTVFLALGAWRLARRRVLVRRSAVIETLGAASVLCVDKTGTLTENRMQVTRMWAGGAEIAVAEGAPLDPRVIGVADAAALAAAVQPIDPMDQAIRRLHCDVRMTQPERTWPLAPGRMAVVQVWRGEGERRTGAAKGAPEAIFKLCGLSEVEHAPLHAVIERMAAAGLRVLGVARCELDGPFPEEPGDAPFAFLGLIGFLDPLRSDARAALSEAKRAGITVMMITGDHPATAMAIARQAGIDVSGGLLRGSEIESLDTEALRARLSLVRVFARIGPTQKLAIVQALKAMGEVVVMTGDGVNDAPALEAADVGVAMGKRGTDIAREAADLILLDDGFASIVGGVRLGRRIFSNLRRALVYVAAIHVPIAGIALAPLLFGLPSLLFPMHVVLLELAIDPMCSLVFEGEPSEAQAMKRRPRRIDEPLFGRGQLAAAAMQGASILAAVLAVYVWSLGHDSEQVARGAGFLTLIVGDLALALTDAMAKDGRMFAPHRLVYWSIVGAISAMMVAAFAVPQLAGLFQVEAPSPLLGAVAVAAGLVSASWLKLSGRIGARVTAAAVAAGDAPASRPGAVGGDRPLRRGAGPA